MRLIPRFINPRDLIITDAISISSVVHTADDNLSLLGPNFIKNLHSLRIDASNLLILTIFTVLLQSYGILFVKICISNIFKIIIERIFNWWIRIKITILYMNIWWPFSFTMVNFHFNDYSLKFAKIIWFVVIGWLLYWLSVINKEISCFSVFEKKITVNNT